MIGELIHERDMARLSGPLERAILLDFKLQRSAIVSFDADADALVNEGASLLGLDDFNIPNTEN